MYLAVKVGENCHVRQTQGNHEPEVINWIKENVKPRMVVFDIGANNGYMSHFFSKAVGTFGEVMAIEADVNNVKLLNQTILLNDLNNCFVIDRAIHNYCGTIKFGISDKCTWSGIKSECAKEWNEVYCTTVDLIALEWYNFNRVDVIKIDVEGTELAVLEGSVRTILEYSPTFLVELHGTDEEEKNHPVLKFFAEHGYSVEYLVYPWFIVAKKI